MKKENKRKTKDIIKCVAKYLIVELLIVLYFGRIIYTTQPIKKEDTYNVTEKIEKVEIIETWGGKSGTKYRLEIHTPNGYYLYPWKYGTRKAEEISEKLMSYDELEITVYEHPTRTLKEYMRFGSVTLKRIVGLKNRSEILLDFDEYNSERSNGRVTLAVIVIIILVLINVFAIYFDISVMDKPKRGNKKERREREKRKIERRKAREKNKKK